MLSAAQASAPVQAPVQMQPVIIGADGVAIPVMQVPASAPPAAPVETAPLLGEKPSTEKPSSSRAKNIRARALARVKSAKLAKSRRID